jgi:ATP-binding cassette subfamily C protein CydD
VPTVARARPVAIRARDLSIGTPDGRPVLSHASLSIPAGAHVAVLGPSGIGKSTLLEALAGLRPHDGEIAFEGSTAPADRPRVGMLTQRPHVFAGSIADNIRLGNPGACDTAVRLAAERAAVTDFTLALPAGLGTGVGENGLGLSGGEAQRVALARVYLYASDIILLD